MNAAAVDAQGKGCVSGNLFTVAAVCYRVSESQHQAGRYSAPVGHRRFTLARLDAVRKHCWPFVVLKSAKPLWGWALQKPPIQLLPQKPHPATPLQAGFPA